MGVQIDILKQVKLKRKMVDTFEMFSFSSSDCLIDEIGGERLALVVSLAVIL